MPPTSGICAVCLDQNLFGLGHIRSKRSQKRLRANANFGSGFKLIWVVQSAGEKVFACSVGQITCINSAVPRSPRGRFAIVTNVGCGMRWTEAAQLTSAVASGRRRRV